MRHLFGPPMSTKLSTPYQPKVTLIEDALVHLAWARARAKARVTARGGGQGQGQNQGRGQQISYFEGVQSSSCQRAPGSRFVNFFCKSWEGEGGPLQRAWESEIGGSGIWGLVGGVKANGRTRGRTRVKARAKFRARVSRFHILKGCKVPRAREHQEGVFLNLLLQMF